MKRYFGFISSQIGSGQAEKEEKKIRSEYHFRLTWATAFPKKIVKKLNKKCHSGFIFSQIGPVRPKKKIIPITVSTQTRIEHSKKKFKKIVKKFRKLKNVILASFLAK